MEINLIQCWRQFSVKFIIEAKILRESACKIYIFNQKFLVVNEIDNGLRWRGRGANKICYDFITYLSLFELAVGITLQPNSGFNRLPPPEATILFQLRSNAKWETFNIYSSFITKFGGNFASITLPVLHNKFYYSRRGSNCVQMFAKFTTELAHGCCNLFFFETVHVYMRLTFQNPMITK